MTDESAQIDAFPRGAKVVVTRGSTVLRIRKGAKAVIIERGRPYAGKIDIELTFFDTAGLSTKTRRLQTTTTLWTDELKLHNGGSHFIVIKAIS